MTQRFGGPHTIFKLAVLELYAEAYAAIMGTQHGLGCVYIDAFASDGDGLTRDGQKYKGSVRLCLEFNPPFSELHFIDSELSNVKRLEAITNATNQNTKVHFGDANDVLPEIIRQIDWTKNRGLIFIDPFGLQLNWPTLQTILQEGMVDVWILFPVFGIRRQLTKQPEEITTESRNRLNQFFGDESWLGAYDSAPDLFEMDLREITEDVLNRITQIYVSKLNPITSYVAEPIPLFENNIHQFSLLFCMSNKSDKAIKLARRLFTETKHRVTRKFSQIS